MLMENPQSRLKTNEILSGSIGFRVVTDSRNVIVDDVYFAQIDGGGAENRHFRRFI